jgi:hypothetical protein
MEVHSESSATAQPLQTGPKLHFQAHLKLPKTDSQLALPPTLFRREEKDCSGL